MAKLSEKQMRFVSEYLVDLNATQAAIRAGYSEKTADVQGSRLLGNVKVADAIAEAQGKRSERTNVDQDYVIETIIDTIERCRQARPVLDRKGFPVMIETPDGEIVPAFTFEASNVLRGAELLGKHLGMFIERKELSGPGGGPIPVRTLSDFYGGLDAEGAGDGG